MIADTYWRFSVGSHRTLDGGGVGCLRLPKVFARPVDRGPPHGSVMTQPDNVRPANDCSMPMRGDCDVDTRLQSNTCLDAGACGARRCDARGRPGDSGPARYLQGRQRIRRAGWRQHPPHAGGASERAGVPQSSFHVHDRQAGRPALFRHLCVAAQRSKAVAVIARSGAIYLVDAEGYTHGTLIAPNQMELCYLKQSPDARVASCALLTKQP